MEAFNKQPDPCWLPVSSKTSASLVGLQNPPKLEVALIDWQAHQLTGRVHKTLDICKTTKTLLIQSDRFCFMCGLIFYILLFLYKKTLSHILLVSALGWVVPYFPGKLTPARVQKQSLCHPFVWLLSHYSLQNKLAKLGRCERQVNFGSMIHNRLCGKNDKRSPLSESIWI